MVKFREFWEKLGAKKNWEADAAALVDEAMQRALQSRIADKR
jgi:hypothetical protein